MTTLLNAIRLNVASGDHGKTLSILLLTEVKCTSQFFVSRPFQSFPVLVTLWTNHSETEVANVSSKKLYDPSSF